MADGTSEVQLHAGPPVSALVSASPGTAVHLWRVFRGAALMQLRSTRNNIEDLTWAVTEPLLALVAVAVLVHAGRPEYAGHALAASFLMTIGMMGFWVGSDTLVVERRDETLELLVVSPASIATVMFARITVVSSLGFLGLIEGWFFIRVLFSVPLAVHHPWLMLFVLLATLFSASCTSVLLSALFSLARQARTYQNALHGPINLLGGVLVPMSYLPFWLKPFAPFIFLSWSADLLRDVFRPESPTQLPFRFAALIALGAAAGLGAYLCSSRILERLRGEGSLGLS